MTEWLAFGSFRVEGPGGTHGRPASMEAWTSRVLEPSARRSEAFFQTELEEERETVVRRRALGGVGMQPQVADMLQERPRSQTPPERSAIRRGMTPAGAAGGGEVPPGSQGPADSQRASGRGQGPPNGRRGIPLLGKGRLPPTLSVSSTEEEPGVCEQSESPCFGAEPNVWAGEACGLKPCGLRVSRGRGRRCPVGRPLCWNPGGVPWKSLRRRPAETRRMKWTARRKKTQRRHVCDHDVLPAAMQGGRAATWRACLGLKQLESAARRGKVRPVQEDDTVGAINSPPLHVAMSTALCRAPRAKSVEGGGMLKVPCVCVPAGKSRFTGPRVALLGEAKGGGKGGGTSVWSSEPGKISMWVAGGVCQPTGVAAGVAAVPNSQKRKGSQAEEVLHFGVLKIKGTMVEPNAEAQGSTGEKRKSVSPACAAKIYDVVNLPGQVAKEEGDLRPVVFLSRKLLPRERNYSVVELEALALFWGVSKLRPYLLGNRFVVQTDHSPLTFLSRAKGQNQRILRWCLTLQDFDFEVTHIPGSKNILADALSRQWSSQEEG